MKLLFDHHLSPSLVRAEISMQHGYPPKLVWLRLGNCTTDDIEELIRAKYLLIAELEQAPDRGILQLFSRDLR